MNKRTTKRTERRTNGQLLKQWLVANKPNAKEKLAHDCDSAFGTSAVNKWINTGKAPNPQNRAKVSKATGIPLDRLFPKAIGKAS